MGTPFRCNQKKIHFSFNSHRNWFSKTNWCNWKKRKLSLQENKHEDYKNFLPLSPQYIKTVYNQNLLFFFSFCFGNELKTTTTTTFFLVSVILNCVSYIWRIKKMTNMFIQIKMILIIITSGKERETLNYLVGFFTQWVLLCSPTQCIYLIVSFTNIS